MKINNTPLSILDLSLVKEGYGFEQALNDSVAYARHIEKLGFKRFWVAEHHNTKGVASSSTAVLIGHLAVKTSKIRVGSGGIMLPNHSPLQVAETFGTLETLYPNRIDLGIGRAPGTDSVTSMALRRSITSSVDDYPKDIAEILTYLGDKNTESKVNAYPGFGTNVPMWILGSSPFSAKLAASLGLPYAFASHFAPTHLEYAMNIYRNEFQPSEYLDKPHFMPAAHIIVAETEEEAIYQSTSHFQMVVNQIKQKSGNLKPPVKNLDSLWTPAIKNTVNQMLQYYFIGTAEQVYEKLSDFINFTDADELMLSSYFYEQKDREKSFELLHNISK